MPTFSAMEEVNCGFPNIFGEDQRVEDDFIGELIRKYLYSEDANSLYADDSFPLLSSPDTDKWPGDMILPDFNDSQDGLVPEQLPELLLMENQHSFDQKGDNAEPDEELLSILEEIITEDELKNKGPCEPVSGDMSVEPLVQHSKTTGSDSEANAQGTQPIKRKRPKKNSTTKKTKWTCRSQPIIMKRRAKQRKVEE